MNSILRFLGLLCTGAVAVSLSFQLPVGWPASMAWAVALVASIATVADITSMK